MRETVKAALVNSSMQTTHFPVINSRAQIGTQLGYHPRELPGRKMGLKQNRPLGAQGPKRNLKQTPQKEALL